MANMRLILQCFISVFKFQTISVKHEVGLGDTANVAKIV